QARPALGRRVADDLVSVRFDALGCPAGQRIQQLGVARQRHDGWRDSGLCLPPPGSPADQALRLGVGGGFSRRGRRPGRAPTRRSLALKNPKAEVMIRKLFGVLLALVVALIVIG